ncbi:Uu.00g126440.m01.CDS01 [Anthostomella pinea]|uniref:Uu.00g126440.m01.CDS01 n=1 Tax=Anthostomella pinea TaxID=933095 RepID=A0AAI8YHP3_9PEZI|nr:Uu.00g126440.m01.CDS01 [Anthostomella pinea]
MEPCSILELSSTVLKVGALLYSFLKAVHDAPADVQKYLEVLSSTRTVFADVEEYAALHERSSFRNVDKMQLDAISAVLQECELTLALQLSTVEQYDTSDATSRFKRLRKNVEFVFGKAALKHYTVRLQASGNLLGQAMVSSVGKNTVIIRDEVGSMRSEMRDAFSAVAEEQQQRQQCLQETTRYTKTLQGGISQLMDFAQTNGIQSGTRLESMANVMAADLSSSLQDDVLPAALDSSDAVDAQGPPSSGTRTNQGPQNLADCLHSDIPTSKEASEEYTTPFPARPDAWQQAVTSFRQSLSSKDLKFLGEVTSPSELVQRLHQKSTAVGLEPSKLKSIMSKISAGSDHFGNPLEIASLLLPSITLLAETGKAVYGDIAAGLEEMADAMHLCQRELQLHQDERMTELVGQAYVQLFEHAKLCTRTVSRKNNTIVVTAVIRDYRAGLDASMARLRRICEKITREVDYRHRVEMREAGRRIAEMHVEQHRMVRMLQDQRAILELMQQERKLMDLIREQQKILQIVQRIQYGMQMERGTQSTMDESPSSQISTAS